MRNDKHDNRTSCILVGFQRKDRVRVSVSRVCDVSPDTTQYYMRVYPEEVIWVTDSEPTPVRVETNTPLWSIE